MSDFLKTLTRRNSLRKQCAELGVADIEKVISDLTDILAERAEEEAEFERQRAEKDLKIATIRQLMQDGSIDLDELVQSIDLTPKKRPVEPKYKVVDEETGEEYFWTGRGRTPLAFQRYFDKGFTKDDCLI